MYVKSLQNKNQPFGIQSACKICERKRSRNYEATKRNRPDSHKKYLRSMNRFWRARRRIIQTQRKTRLVSMMNKDILDFYKRCPEGFVVDHIIPITNKNVCGLHVPWNFQYLTWTNNSKKNNKFDGTHHNEGWKKYE